MEPGTYTGRVMVSVEIEIDDIGHLSDAEIAEVAIDATLAQIEDDRAGTQVTIARQREFLPPVVSYAQEAVTV